AFGIVEMFSRGFECGLRILLDRTAAVVPTAAGQGERSHDGDEPSGNGTHEGSLPGRPRWPANASQGVPRFGPTEAIRWPAASPEPSRRPVASGNSTGTPLAAAARAGAGPAHAKMRVSSPLRNRWHRTPPVARPLAGYSSYGVTLTDPACVPGSEPLDPETVTTTLSALGSTAQNPTTDAFEASLIPAIPPPDRPWGRP